MPQVFDLSKPRYSPAPPVERHRAQRRSPAPQRIEEVAPEAKATSGELPGETGDYASPRAALARLIHAVALEEISLAWLVKAEAEKVERSASQAVGIPSFDEVIALQRSAADVINTVVRKEETLLEKLNVLLALAQALGQGENADGVSRSRKEPE